MTLTDSQYKTLLDAQAICVSLATERGVGCSVAMEAAGDLKRLIEYTKRIPEPEDAEMPF